MLKSTFLRKISDFGTQMVCLVTRTPKTILSAMMFFSSISDLGNGSCVGDGRDTVGGIILNQGFGWSAGWWFQWDRIPKKVKFAPKLLLILNVKTHSRCEVVDSWMGWHGWPAAAHIDLAGWCIGCLLGLAKGHFFEGQRGKRWFNTV